MEVLAVIPARGGSKSVPRKNIRPLLGKPLIAWIIGEAKKSKYITRAIVSTDDPEIAAVARAHGAEVPFLRPAELAQDLSTDVEFLLHALEWLKREENYEPEIVVRLPPTAPHDLPRQLFPKVYVQAGAMDVIRFRTLRDMKSTSGKKLAYFFMEANEAINIDHEIDFAMAEFFMQRRLRSQGGGK